MTVQDASLSRFLTVLFRRWEEQSLPYLVLRNYEALPATTSNDVDVLIGPASLGDAARLLRVAAGETGWKLHNVAEFACTSVYLFNPDTLEQVHIDLMGGIRWHFLQYGDHRLLLDARRPCRGFFIPAPAHEAAINLMTRLLYSGSVREKYRTGIQSAATRHGAMFTDALAPWIGRRTASRFCSLAAAGNWPAIEHAATRARLQVLLANLRRPWSMLHRLGRDMARFARRTLHPPGLFVVFLGPDGSGKTTVAEGVAQRMSATFSPERTLHCHWKPVRPRRHDAPATVDPHGKEPRSAFLSVLYFGYHYMAFPVGRWRTIHPVLFRGGLVMIDRYYHDFHADLRRYRLRIPAWLIRLGHRFVYEPDLVFCLDAPVEVLQARKAEVSKEECQRQREAYRNLVAARPNGRVLDASAPADRVVDEALRHALGYLAQRASAAMRR